MFVYVSQKWLLLSDTQVLTVKILKILVLVGHLESDHYVQSDLVSEVRHFENSGSLDGTITAS